MESIKLNFNKFNIGELTYNDGEYTFKINEESTKMLIKISSEFAIFETNGKKELKSKSLFLPFKKFLPDTEEKETLMEEIGILKSDNDFEKLLKIKKLQLDKTTFWLE